MSGSSVNKDSTDAELIEACRHVGPENFLGHCPYGNYVIKISDTLVLRYAGEVTEAEAINPIEARKLVDPRIVRIP